MNEKTKARWRRFRSKRDALVDDLKAEARSVTDVVSPFAEKLIERKIDDAIEDAIEEAIDPKPAIVRMFKRAIRWFSRKFRF